MCTVGGRVPSPTKSCPMEKSRNKDSTNPMSTTLFYLLNISPQKANRTPWRNS